MIKKKIENRKQRGAAEKSRNLFYALFTMHCSLPRERSERAFTLIETLVAISILTIAIVAPMTLVSRSIAAAYYARDQITAFHLAQEAIETVRHVRDHNVLETALGTPTDILLGIPLNTPFVVNTVEDIDDAIDEIPCISGTCPALQRDPTDTFYGYGAGWTDTRFTRTVEAETVREDESEIPQEIRISVTVSWQTSSFQSRSFTISENLYRWVQDGSSSS